MTAQPRPLTGRVAAAPDALIDEELLQPQFLLETERLLPWYLQEEKVLLLEYERMGVLTHADAVEVADILHHVDAEQLIADKRRNLSDVSFAIERLVEGRMSHSIPTWHVDRSRNDLQACAQLMFAREQITTVTGALVTCARAAVEVAGRYLTTVMPGYTHLQAAQVMTPAFYLTAMASDLLHAARRMLAVYDEIDLCPLGAGAMTGQELAWDRERIAALLGFTGPQSHPLIAVASRSWVLQITGELSTTGVQLSRYVSDLMAWGGGQYSFIELPDEFAGISSSMPQKRNYPVLERIRGRLSRLTADYLNATMAQRATPFANSVEVSKEGNVVLRGAIDTACSSLDLLSAVLSHLAFDEDALREACEAEFLGGFSLANSLTLTADVPWRTAQVIAGEYIASAIEEEISPADVDGPLLEEAAEQHGHHLRDATKLLTHAFDVDEALTRKQPVDSTHPAAVSGVLDEQWALIHELDAEITARVRVVTGASAQVDQMLSLSSVEERG